LNLLNFVKVPVSEYVISAEFARLHNVGAPAVSNWKKRGLLVFVQDPANPRRQLIDVAKSNLLVGGMVDPNKGRPTAASMRATASAVPPASAEPFLAAAQDSELQRERLRELRARTSRREMENDKLAGELVIVSEFERRASDLGRQARERIQSAFRLESERLAAETDPRTVQVLCAALIDQTFESLADQIEAEARAETEIDQALAAINEADPMLDLDQVAAA
jgi:hypothetical protein